MINIEDEVEGGEQTLGATVKRSKVGCNCKYILFIYCDIYCSRALIRSTGQLLYYPWKGPLRHLVLLTLVRTRGNCKKLF